MGFETLSDFETVTKQLSFQSSFSEYGLWNIFYHYKLLKTILTFNPRFLSMGFETEMRFLIISLMKPFNPRFLSMGFETNIGIAYLLHVPVFQSSFSEYGLWNSVFTAIWDNNRHLSILVFWVWALKHATAMSAGSFIAFQSSFSEYGLWNST